MRLYYPFSEAMREKYGQKLYKIPLHLPVTCPGRMPGGLGPCSYCSPMGTGYEMLDAKINLNEQLSRNIQYISRKYNVTLFGAYFQNYTNTFLPASQLQEALMQIQREDVKEIFLSTRPDCLGKDTARLLGEVSQRLQKEITIELGLQSCNWKTLERINRGHSLAEFIDSVLTAKSFGLNVVAHVILDLPWDEPGDVIECSKILSALGVDGVKLHSLYIPKGCEMEPQLAEGKLTLLTQEEYVERAVEFLCWLSPDCVIHRLVGRIPKEYSVVANFHTSWWVIKEQIERTLEQRNLYQGARWGYLDGSALRKAGLDKK